MSRQIALPAGMPRPITRSALAAGESAQPIFTPKDILRALRRRMWLIIIVTTLSAILGVISWYILKQYCPAYSSSAVIRCKMPVQEGVFSTQSLMPNTQVISMETASRAANLNNEGFLSNVLSNRRAVQETSWFKEWGDSAKRMENMKSSFRASPIRDTDLVKVSMTASSPEEAKLILDEALQEFMSRMRETAEGALRDTLEALNKERTSVEEQLKANEEELRRLSLDAAPGWSGTGATIVTQQLNMLNTEILRLTAMGKELDIEKQQLEAEEGYSTDVRMAVDQDSMVSRLKAQLTNAIQYRDSRVERLGELHREIQEIDSTIVSNQNQLKERESVLLKQYAMQEKMAMEQRIQAIAQQLKDITQQYREVESSQRIQDQKAMTYARRMDENRSLRRQLDQFDQQIYEMNVKKRDPDRVRAEIANGATLPKMISFPLLQIFLPGAIVLGLMISAGLAFLLEFLNDSIKSPIDVKRYLNVPLLGMIPFYEKDEEESEDICVEKITISRPDALISEFYRQIKTSLFLSGPTSELKTILISSGLAGGGKTTTAVNLAVTLAAEGKRVLLVDANFRRSALNRLFPAEGPPHGLSNILAGHVSASDVIRPSGAVELLDIIDSGPLPPHPANLLHSQRMQGFLESQKQYYDYVIIDGPPSLVVVDARILAEMVDGTILVVEAELTARGIAQRMINEIKGGKAKIIGVLLNAVKSHKGGYFERAYKSYYDYTAIRPLVAGDLPAGNANTVDKKG
jgi:polysaccharide biosynthesis transport protein